MASQQDSTTQSIYSLGSELRSTDTGTEARGYAYGDTGYGIFQKQPFRDTVSIYKIK